MRNVAINDTSIIMHIADSNGEAEQETENIVQYTVHCNFSM